MTVNRKATRIIPLIIMAAGVAFAGHHHAMNGTWVLMPDRSDFAGQSAIQTGTVTIYDREGNIYVSRTLGSDGADGTASYTVSLDSSENSSIHDGNTKYKARWRGDELEVITTRDKVPSVERFQLQPDGTLALTIGHPDRPRMKLVFQRR